MDTNQNQNQFKQPDDSQVDANFLQSTTARVIMVGLLTLILLLPLHYVQGIIKERSTLQETVVSDITEKWGSHVYICGPILKIPYKAYGNQTTQTDTVKTVQNRVYTDYLYVFPEMLKADSKVNTFEKHRNNYDAAVFNANLKLTGNYPVPDLARQNISPDAVEWDKASVIINTNAIKSIKGTVNARINDNLYSFEAAEMDNQENLATLQTAPINLKSAALGSIPFEIKISYDGSNSFAIVPIGKLTEATMAGNWPSPKFTGNYLPEKHDVTDNGFTASWNISQLNRPFAQQYTTLIPKMNNYSFDVDFVIPVDEFQQNERASKYGFLVIGLTFLVFFLIQTVSKINIHIFQYTMIGLALVMFYTLLISITEHSSFWLAYLIAGVSVVTMIGLYSLSILKDRKFPVFIATALTGLYTFIYVIIQLENYALLAGSIGLFLILGAVMYFSRKIQWNTSIA
ncbi:hypothetical protein AM493_08030 [Flavobacterium akiainvivens]|uniref:Cell envelope integrity protein CreD n=1 Tax=Flavobacterium akiainvivens TaxID=1202724 RepID=A0A0M9VHV9_9FLAO|nr:cell envelope integrity protein CreD [Flavobacterium akiainvivens]KOS05990.1 hypothetical protein AM493_08030 [Flavobacterium akiainvivens]SFQ53985.1 inner membrane protein [Flavobacterium akiainvivens]